MADDFSANTSTSGGVTVGGTASGNIETADDRDWFAVDLVAGRTYTIHLRGSPTDDGTLSDPLLYGIHDADGNLVANTRNDDGGDGRNSKVTFTATASGTFYIAAGAYGSNRGTYEVEVTDNAADDTRAGATDLGDITALAGPRFPRGTLDGDADQVDYYRFTLTEAKRVDLGLRQQDANADLFLEDADGDMLYRSTTSGTANERIAETLLAGTYYLRVESQETGANAHVVRYGVSAPDPDRVTALQEQSGTAVNEAPSFAEASYTFALAENADGSTNRVSLGTVAATDPEGTTLAYSLAGGNESGSFEVDAASGELFYKGSGEDFESGTTQFTLTVRASDGSETADTTVTVDVTDVNETPTFAETSYAFDLAENADGSTNRMSLGTARGDRPRGHDTGLQPRRWQRIGLVRGRRDERRALLQGFGRGLRVRHNPIHPDGARERRERDRRHHRHRRRHRRGRGGRGRPAGHDADGRRRRARGRDQPRQHHRAPGAALSPGNGGRRAPTRSTTTGSPSRRRNRSAWGCASRMRTPTCSSRTPTATCSTAARTPGRTTR